MSLLERGTPPVTTTGRTAGRATGRTTGTGFLAQQVGLLIVAAGVYFSVRHLTAGEAGTARDNAHLLIDLERSLGAFHELALQRLALDVDGVTTIVNGIYIWGHWPVIAGVLGWLAWRHRSAFVVYRNALLLSGLVGMLIVAVFPVAPPRLLDLGFVDTVVAHTDAYRVMQPPSFTNQYAAMPSFHVGWDLLVGIALVREARHRWVRVAGLLLPWLMLASVVISGNHFFVDAVVGDAIVLASLALATRWARGPGPGRGRAGPVADEPLPEEPSRTDLAGVASGP